MRIIWIYANHLGQSLVHGSQLSIICITFITWVVYIDLWKWVQPWYGANFHIFDNLLPGHSALPFKTPAYEYLLFYTGVLEGFPKEQNLGRSGRLAAFNWRPQLSIIQTTGQYMGLVGEFQKADLP